MQIPPPEPMPIITAFIICTVVLSCRWIGIYGLVRCLGGERRLAGVSTVNLSEVSEFALVIVSLGMQQDPPHVESDTLTIMIWVFALLGIMSANMLPHNYAVWAKLSKACTFGKAAKGEEGDDDDDDVHGHHHRNILFLGFHKVAAMLTYQLHHESPHVLDHIHVVDVNEAIVPKIIAKGATASYGDISSADVLEHAVHGEVRMVLSTVADSVLRSVSGTTNSDILRAALELWPDAKVVVTADSPKMTARLYSEGAYYVVRVSELCADRLYEILHLMTESYGGHDLYGDPTVSHALTRTHMAVASKSHGLEEARNFEARVSKNHVQF
jgi:hypothetical protein